MHKFKTFFAAFAVATIATGCDPQAFVNGTGPTGNPSAGSADFSVAEPPTSDHKPNPGGYIENGNQVIPCDPPTSPEFR